MMSAERFACSLALDVLLRGVLSAYAMCGRRHVNACRPRGAARH